MLEELVAVLIFLLCPVVKEECCKAGKQAISTAAFQKGSAPDNAMACSPGTGLW